MCLCADAEASGANQKFQVLPLVSEQLLESPTVVLSVRLFLEAGLPSLEGQNPGRWKAPQQSLWSCSEVRPVANLKHCLVCVGVNYTAAKRKQVLN